MSEHTHEEPKYDLGTLDYMVKLNAKFAKIDRRRVRRLVISVAIDLALTLAIGFGGYQLHRVNQQSQYAACMSTNKARADNRHLWDYVISISSAKPISRSVVEFEHYLNAATAARSCSQFK